MVYDAFGRRVEQTNSSGTAEILYGPNGSKLALMSGQSVTKAFVPLPGGTAAVYTGSTLAWYRHPDWLGSSRLASTLGGGLSYDDAYAPFGETEAETGTSDRSFTGQNQDLTANLYDFPYREYNPLHGRWISPDPAGIKAVSPANPQSWNRYAYVNGSPLNRVDPLGLCTPGNLTTGSMNCGWQQAVGWLISQGGWDPAAGMSAPPSGGLSNSATEITTSAATADEGWYAVNVRATYILSVLGKYPELQDIFWGFGNNGVITSTRIVYDAELDALASAMLSGTYIYVPRRAPAVTKGAQVSSDGQRLIAEVAKRAGPVASPCFWVEWTAGAVAAGGIPAVGANLPYLAGEAGSPAAINWGVSKLIQIEAGQVAKPGILALGGQAWRMFDAACVP